MESTLLDHFWWNDSDRRVRRFSEQPRSPVYAGYFDYTDKMIGETVRIQMPSIIDPHIFFRSHRTSDRQPDCTSIRLNQANTSICCGVCWFAGIADRQWVDVRTRWDISMFTTASKRNGRGRPGMMTIRNGKGEPGARWFDPSILEGRTNWSGTWSRTFSSRSETDPRCHANQPDQKTMTIMTRMGF